MKGLIIRCNKCGKDYDYREIRLVNVVQRKFKFIPFFKKAEWTEVCQPCEDQLRGVKAER